MEVETLCNRGMADLHLMNAALRDDDPAFELGSFSTVQVSPDECSTFEVTFSPQAGVVSKVAAIIDCDDDDGCPEEVSLRGEGMAAR